MRNVGSRVANVTVHLPHDTDVFVAVEQRVLVLPLHAHTAAATAVRGLVRFEAGIGEYDDEPRCVLVTRRNGNVLFGNKLG